MTGKTIMEKRKTMVEKKFPILNKMVSNLPRMWANVFVECCLLLTEMVAMLSGFQYNWDNDGINSGKFSIF